MHSANGGSAIFAAMRRLALLLVLLTAAAQAQPAAPAGELPPLPFAPAAPVPRLSDRAEVSVLTMLPGREVYSLFGHTALRVRDPALGLDRTYNYGTFDFEQPGFVLRFLRGQLDYRLAVGTFERTLAEYRYLERPVIEQGLALSPKERQRLFLFAETNALPEHREYRYDFLFDNCSTRPRDALEWAAGERLNFGDYRPDEATFREIIEPYLDADPALELGIDLGFGRPTDRTATPREAMFLPLELFRALDAATLDGEPLVTATDTLFWVKVAGVPEETLDWPTALAWVLLALGLLLSALAWRGDGGRAARRFDVALLAVAGFAGLVLALLWFGTEHRVTKQNPDLLWAWPTHLGVAWLVGRHNSGDGLRVYLGAAALASIVAAALALLSDDLHAAVVPLGLLLAVRCGACALRPARLPSSTV